MKKSLFPIIAGILLAGSVLLGLNDTGISVADTSIPDKEVTSSVSRNSSASATITIMMTGILNG